MPTTQRPQPPFCRWSNLYTKNSSPWRFTPWRNVGKGGICVPEVVPGSHDQVQITFRFEIPSGIVGSGEIRAFLFTNPCTDPTAEMGETLTPKCLRWERCVPRNSIVYLLLPIIPALVFVAFVTCCVVCVSSRGLSFTNQDAQQLITKSSLCFSPSATLFFSGRCIH